MNLSEFFTNLANTNIKDALPYLISIITILISITWYFTRYRLIKEELQQRESHNNRNNEFKVFIEATKLLTDEKATVISKISAMYLLYDIAFQYPDKVERTLQVINKQIHPLIRRIDSETDKVLSTSSNNEKTDINCKSLHSINYGRENIKEWQYNGEDDEVVISNSLFIIRKIITDCLPKTNLKVDLSNVIIFDLDLTTAQDFHIANNNHPIENLIFFHCKLDRIDFKSVNFHFCKFINCNLNSSDFSGANLWGSLFLNCVLDKACFRGAECEGVEFRNSYYLNIFQLESMSFKNRNNERLLIILPDEDNNLNDPPIYETDRFKDEQEYKEWKKSQRLKMKSSQ